MPTTPSRELAIRASQRLRTITGNLRTKASCREFCSKLFTTFRELSCLVESIPADEDCESEVACLLAGLECSCKKLHPQCMREASNDQSRVTESPYPAVSLLLTDEQRWTRAIHDLASTETLEIYKEKADICNNLQRHLPKSALKSRSSTAKAGLQAPEYGRESSLLYKALHEYCFCGRDLDERIEVVAKIRLYANLEDDFGVTFGVLFLDHPHEQGTDLESQPWWQDTYISVMPSVLVLSSTLEIANSYKPCRKFEDTRSSGHQEIPPKTDVFCDLISSRGHSLLRFSLTEGKLSLQDNKDPEKEWAINRPSISLRKLLESVDNNLAGKMKEVLSWILAKAVWQYYSEPWMHEPWNTENIHFLFERRTSQDYHSAGIFVNEPLLSLSLANQPGPDSSQHGTEDITSHLGPKITPLHSMPKILALGFMLMEIQLGGSIESVWKDWPTFVHDGMPATNTNLNICRSLMKQEKFVVNIPHALKNLITRCLEPRGYFRRNEDEHNTRDKLYKLVKSLEDFVVQISPHWVDPLNVPDSLIPHVPPTIPMPLSRPTHPVEPSQLPSIGHVMSQIPSSTSSEAWFDRMKSLNYILDSPEDHEPYSKVKIAVLDTGIKPTNDSSNRISDYKDFIDKQDDVKCDKTGHGTNSVNLVLDMCEPAEVFCLRVFETDQPNDNTSDLVIKAINWCIKKKVDIICMAFGFNEEPSGLHSAISRAYSAGILMFAAPSNDSNAGEIRYPARYHDNVFCMFSTDGGVKNSRHLNPSGMPSMEKFAILGENICGHDAQTKSGTSYSAAIAAGLAGRLLDFSRHKDTERSIEAVHMIEQRLGILSIFRHMAIFDAGYQCIKPWKLMPPNLLKRVPFTIDDMPDNTERSKARQKICNVLGMNLASL